MNEPTASPPSPPPTDGGRADNVLREATRRLRRLALDSAEGAFLGAEAELLQRLQVSRPTLRQALRLLEHEQLVRMKMGPTGGVYVARPEVDSVVRAAATYLQARQAPLGEMLRVISLLTGHVIGLAAACTDATLREALTAFVEKADRQPQDLSPELFHALDAEFTAVIRAMASNRSLDLFVQVAQRVIELNPESRALITDATLMRLRRRMWRQLAEAILAHDAPLARRLAEQQLDLVFAAIPTPALDRVAVAADRPDA